MFFDITSCIKKKTLYWERYVKLGLHCPAKAGEKSEKPAGRDALMKV